jgi:ADP-ribose pyrophosphatase YjhB (NUDIX family)
MSSSKPECNNTSVGVVLLSSDQQSLFLQKRVKFPWGWACPAGHVDEGETFDAAALRELEEETGLQGHNLRLVHEEAVDNKCRRPKGDWHHWRVYQAEASGTVNENPEEALQAGWYPLTHVRELARRTAAYNSGRIPEEEWRANPGLEPVWYDFLTELGII